MFSAICANNILIDRHRLWSNLQKVEDTNNGPWIIGGDFNEVLFNSENFGGNTPNMGRTNRFMDCLNYCKKIDPGYSSSKYTCSNKRKRGNTILERLDRVVCNYE